MKILAFFLAIMMAIGCSSAFALSQTAEGVLEARTHSDLRPVEDAAHLSLEVIHTTDKGLDMIPVVKEREKVMEPARMAVKETVKASKTIVNTVWDGLTMPARKMMDKE